MYQSHDDRLSILQQFVVSKSANSRKSTHLTTSGGNLDEKARECAHGPLHYRKQGHIHRFKYIHRY
jgi:hypothetical protein